jgi:hypothetical protein
MNAVVATVQVGYFRGAKSMENVYIDYFGGLSPGCTSLITKPAKEQT